MSAANQDSVSVAMTTYNGARYLGEQLRSIAEQELLPAELVICDDGSTDDTVEIARRFAATAPFPVHVHVNERNMGWQANFMQAAHLCTSSIIAFCDQDDAWYPTKLKRMVRCFEDAQVLCAYHNARVADETLQPLWPFYNAEAEHAALATMPLHPWHGTYGYTLLTRAGLRQYDDIWPLGRDHNNDVPMAHDQWYVFLALLLGRVEFVDEELCFYRQHGGNAVGARKQLTRFQRLHRYLKPATGWESLAAVAAERRALIAQALAPRIDPELRPKILSCAKKYHRLSQALGRRDRAYRGKNLTRRMVLLAGSVLLGDYSAQHMWKLHWRTLPRDIGRIMLLR